MELATITVAAYVRILIEDTLGYQNEISIHSSFQLGTTTLVPLTLMVAHDPKPQDEDATKSLLEAHQGTPLHSFKYIQERKIPSSFSS